MSVEVALNIKEEMIKKRFKNSAKNQIAIGNAENKDNLNDSHNLDGMLAQLCTLEKALDCPGKSKKKKKSSSKKLHKTNTKATNKSHKSNKDSQITKDSQHYRKDKKPFNCYYKISDEEAQKSFSRLDDLVSTNSVFRVLKESQSKRHNSFSSSTNSSNPDLKQNAMIKSYKKFQSKTGHLYSDSIEEEYSKANVSAQQRECREFVNEKAENQKKYLDTVEKDCFTSGDASTTRKEKIKSNRCKDQAICNDSKTTSLEDLQREKSGRVTKSNLSNGDDNIFNSNKNEMLKKVSVSDGETVVHSTSLEEAHGVSNSSESESHQHNMMHCNDSITVKDKRLNENELQQKMSDLIHPHCRVITVKPPGHKKNKKTQKFKTDADISQHRKKIVSKKESVEKSEKAKAERRKKKQEFRGESEKKSESKENPSQEVKRLVKSSDTLEKQSNSRKQKDYYCSSRTAHRTKEHHQRESKSKSKKYLKSLEQENSLLLFKTKGNTLFDATKQAKEKYKTLDNFDQKKISPEFKKKYRSERINNEKLNQYYKHTSRSKKNSQNRKIKEDKTKKFDENDCKSRKTKKSQQNGTLNQNENLKCSHDYSGSDEIPQGSRIVDTLYWHTTVNNVSVRPELRGMKLKTLHGNGACAKRQGHNSSQPIDLPSLSNSDSESFSSSFSSSYATGSSFESSLSRQSSSETEHGSRRLYLDKYNNNGDIHLQLQEKHRILEKLRNLNEPSTKPRCSRSASSGSSFQRQPVVVSSCRRKVKYSKAKEDTTGSKRCDGDHGNKLNIDDKDIKTSNSLSHDKVFEPKFGERRVRQANKRAVEEEGYHSHWQNHQLVLVSQKPENGSKIPVTQQKNFPEKQTTTKLKSQPASHSMVSGHEHRSLTIRHLYNLHNVLSDTRNGTVISGYRKSDGIRVAIKRISKAGTSRWGWLNGKVVPLELSLLCQVNEVPCGGVVSVIEWHETSEAYLLVMTRPHPSVDLYDYVTKHKRLKESLAKHIIRQLVVALQHCIKCGVLHRDVKLENILFNPTTHEITLIDFGCGDYIRNGTYKEFAGTPEYYPPEWFTHKQYNGESMTVWSVGVLLYSLLCGSLPFRSSKEISEKEICKFPNDVSRKARELIDLLLKKKPRDRMRLSDILSHTWMSKTESRSSKNAST